MAKLYTVLLTTTMLTGWSLSGIAPVSAGPKSPNISSPPSIVSMRPNFTMRAPHALRYGDTGNRDTIELLRMKKNTENNTQKKQTNSASRGRPGSGVPGAAGSRSGVPGAAGANVSGNVPASGGPGRLDLTPNRLAVPHQLQQHVKGMNPAELKAMLELIKASRAGRGTGFGVGVLPHTPRGNPGGTWHTGDDVPDPLHRNRTGSGPDTASGPFSSPEPNTAEGIERQRHQAEWERTRQRYFGNGSAPNPGFNDRSGEASDGQQSGPYGDNHEPGWVRRDRDSSRQLIDEDNDGLPEFVIFKELWTNDDGSTYTRRAIFDLRPGGDVTYREVTRRPDGGGEATGVKDNHDPVHIIVLGPSKGSDPAPDNSYGRASNGGSGGNLGYARAMFGGRMISCFIGSCIEGVYQTGRVGDPAGPDDGNGTSTGSGGGATQAGTGPSAATDPIGNEDYGQTGGGGGVRGNPGSDSGSMGGGVSTGDTGPHDISPSIPGAPTPGVPTR